MCSILHLLILMRARLPQVDRRWRPWYDDFITVLQMTLMYFRGYNLLYFSPPIALVIKLIELSPVKTSYYMINEFSNSCFSCIANALDARTHTEAENDCLTNNIIFIGHYGKSPSISNVIIVIRNFETYRYLHGR